jgi:hypothetical protein
MVNWIILFLLSVATSRAQTLLPATSELIKWVGRRSVAGELVYFDWEGVNATISVSGFSYVGVYISDNCPGSGARWGVTMTSSNPNVAPPNHRIQTFYSGTRSGFYYLYNNPAKSCDPNCDMTGSFAFSLMRLTESRLSLCGPGANLSISAFETDGTFLSAPPNAPRRLEFVGDSITAGDLNDASPASICANGAWNDDISLSSGAVLCQSFGADCMYTAWGGIQLGSTNPNAPSWGMQNLYPFTFSSNGPAAYLPWNFTAWAVDAVVVNLGTNDHPTAPALGWQLQYQQFVTNLVSSYYQNANLTVFCAYGPMTSEYEPFVLNITANLAAQGMRVFPLDLTLTHPMQGCYGHPSAADNVEIAAKAQTYIAGIMGW